MRTSHEINLLQQNALRADPTALILPLWYSETWIFQNLLFFNCILFFPRKKFQVGNFRLKQEITIRKAAHM